MDDRYQASLFEDNAEYDAFTEKFKPKKTTDDCYTPALVYEAVAQWTAKEYGLDPACFVRPFFPELDFVTFNYPDGCVIVDNPPFSLLAKIIRFYTRTGRRFLLFAPTMTLFTAAECPVCYLPTGVDVRYENGAVVKTSFVTNLDTMRLRTVPELHVAVRDANRRACGESKKELPKYEYPPELLTAAAACHISEKGVALDIAPTDAVYVSALDSQKAQGKSIFGGGLLLSVRAAAERAAAERAAAERAAAERAAAKVWELSGREQCLRTPGSTHTHTHTQTGALFGLCLTGSDT